MKQVIGLMIRFNASALLKLWFNYITIPYGEIVLRETLIILLRKTIIMI